MGLAENKAMHTCTGRMYCTGLYTCMGLTYTCALFFFREMRWTEAVYATLVAVSVHCPVHVGGSSPCYSRRLVRSHYRLKHC